jgi:hypothetical protein
MAKPITAERFIKLCEEWGVKYRAIKSTWPTHNRNHKGPWENLNGIMMHHTGPFGTVRGMEQILWDGYSGLPGPLCHSGIDPSGILTLAGWGRANHAGLGDPDVFEKVKSENYTGILKPRTASIDGNAHFYGFEIMADGNKPMTDEQRITSVRVAALLCTEHRWKAESVIAHGEWQPGKWDPGANKKLIDMARFRNEVEQAIKEGPKPKLPTRPKPKTKEIVVARGDTFFSLAKKYYPGHGPDGVIELLEDNPHLLRIGDKLIVPNK